MWSIQNLLSEAEAAKERFVSGVIGQQRPFDDSSSSRDPQQQKQQDNGNDTDTAAAVPSSTNSNISSIVQPTIAVIPGSKNTNHDKNNTNNEQQQQQQQQVFTTLKSTLTSALTATKAATQQAIQNIEKEQTKIQHRFFQSAKSTGGPHLRDLSLPLDTESLRDAEVVYITDRLITMGHPALQSPVDGDITPSRKLAAVQHLLQKRHGGKYMIWNLSELEYDYSIFDNQVMTFEFPGSPSPPLGLWMKIILSLESWLKADEKNVAVMHCLTGRGRTSTVMSAFLCWVGEASFGDPNRALEYMAQCKKLDLETLTIPSQRRYVGYFKNMLDGVRPSQPPLLLKRVILSEAPKFEKYQVTAAKDGTQNDPKNAQQHAGKLGCAPYLQIFKGGTLIHTAAASKSFHQDKDELPFCYSFEKSITFPMETVVQGDILIRCRHLTRKGQRVSMFRAALHTGYVPPKVLRLRKSEIDGACSDKRYADDFFVDLVFEECSADMASKHLLSSPPSVEQDGGCEEDHMVPLSKDNHDDDDGASKAAIKVTASVYDSMLHRDSRFWDMIAQRRKERSQPSTSSRETENIGGSVESKEKTSTSPFYGPTIGRRREFLHETVKTVKEGDGIGQQMSVSTHKSEIHAFTIGGELDFTSARVKSKSSVEEVVKKEVSAKDDLMDALMAIDDDIEDDEVAHDESDDIDRNSIDDGNGADVDRPDDGLKSSTEEIVFYDDAQPVDSRSSEAKVEKDIDRGVDASVPIQKSPQASSEPLEKNDKGPNHGDNDSINIDDLNIDDLEKIDAGDQEGADAYHLSDEDDDIADLEEFLKKASV